MNILFVASHANFAEELDRIQAARELAGESLQLTARWSVSAHELCRLMEEQSPDVVHLVAGEGNPENRGLWFDRGGMVETISPAAFGKMFALPQGKPPWLVVLNVCRSLRYAEEIAPHVGAVVAMNDVIDDSAVTAFTTHFYISLAFGSTVAKAFEEGRSAVFWVAPEQIDEFVLLAGTADPSTIKLALPPAGPLGCMGGTPEARAKAVKLFCCYCHEDQKFRAQLETHLAPLQQQDAIHVWHDRRIVPGSDWREDIDKNLEEADIVLLLFSADFMASRYCTGIEMKRALARRDSGSTHVVPILIRKCDLEGSALTSLQWLPTNSKPVKSWRDRDEAWTDVAKGIRRVVESLIEERSGARSE